ncbi:hypothetical protein [Helicobacter sp. T3_23-1059]
MAIYKQKNIVILRLQHNRSISSLRAVLARRGNLYHNTHKIDCHDSSLFDKSLESHNDKKTHPQTPSAREGVLRGVATLSNEGAFLDFHADFDKLKSAWK